MIYQSIVGIPGERNFGHLLFLQAGEVLMELFLNHGHELFVVIAEVDDAGSGSTHYYNQQGARSLLPEEKHLGQYRDRLLEIRLELLEVYSCQPRAGSPIS